MKNILLIETSPRGSDSYSHQAARSIVNELQTRNPGSAIVVRDLGRTRRRSTDCRLLLSADQSVRRLLVKLSVG